MAFSIYLNHVFARLLFDIKKNEDAQVKKKIILKIALFTIHTPWERSLALGFAGNK